MIDLGYRPRPWQEEVHNGLKRFSALVVHRRGGKTVLAIMTLLDAALRTTKASARYAYIAPFRNQAKDIAWRYLTGYARKIPGVSISEGELAITLPNGSQIKIYGADNADALRGIYLDGAVLDEVAQMRPDVWGEILRPALSDRRGWALFIGTPKGMNLFSELFFAARNNPEWYAGLYTVYDTGALPDAEIEAVKTELSPNAFAQEFLCDFSAANENCLLSTAQVDEACRRHYNEGQYGHAAKILGVDVARQGDDRTVIFGRQGIASFTPVIMQGADSMQVADRVALMINEWSPDAVFVDGSGGYGAGVIDRLRTLKHRVTEVQFGGSPGDQRYANKRAEMWFNLATWIKEGGAIPNLPALKLDLCAPTYSHDNRDKLKLESKEDIKKRGMPSPDLGDALALTFAFPVRPQVLKELDERVTAGAARRPYDPLASVRRVGR